MSEIIDTTTIRKPRLSEDSDSEFDPQFKPVVTLPEVEIVTNEENETVILTMRAKLYRFDTTNEPSEWKERGTGEMKILEHNENHSVRIVMRRDKTFKVCANHFITPWMMLKPCFGSERAFIYSVPADFADEEPKSECFAIKFGSVDNANLFKSKFEETKETLLTKCCLYNGQCDKENEINSDSSEEDEKIAEKLAHLDVSKGESDDK